MEMSTTTDPFALTTKLVRNLLQTSDALNNQLQDHFDRDNCLDSHEGGPEVVDENVHLKDLCSPSEMSGELLQRL